MKSLVLLLICLALGINAAVAETSVPSNSRSEAIAALMAEARQENARQSASDAPVSSEHSTTSLMATMLQSLAVCLGIFFVGFHFYKRFAFKTGPSGKRALQLLDRVAVSSKTQLILVQVEGQKRLFTIGSERVTALDARDLNDKRRLTSAPPIELLCESELKMSA